MILKSSGLKNISCEFFPPKTEQGFEQLKSASHALAALKPAFFSVTFGAGGSTQAGTLQALNTLRVETQVPIVPHISSIGMTKAQIVKLLTTYQAMGVKQIIALRGDLPSGMGGEVGEIRFAYELVELIRASTGNHFEIMVAAYPEVHPQAQNATQDLLNLQRKFAAGANCAITQFFFNPDAYFYFLDACGKVGIDAPIIPGIMPITHYIRLARFATSCGAEIPRWLMMRLSAYGDDVQAITDFGLDVVANLGERLLAGGAPGLHFYTLNKAQATLQVMAQLTQVK
jgi:methylenetetrahydrofolate reductase (NADPH)